MSDRDRKPKFRRSGGKGPDGPRESGRRPAWHGRDASPDGPVILYGWAPRSRRRWPIRSARFVQACWLTENAVRGAFADDNNIAIPVTPEIVRPNLIDQRLRAGCGASGPIERKPIPCPRPISIRAGAGRHRAGAFLTRSPTRTMSARSMRSAGGLRCQGYHRHHGASQPRGDRRAGEIRLRRAGTGAAGDGAKSRARAHRDELTRAS